MIRLPMLALTGALCLPIGCSESTASAEPTPPPTEKTTPESTATWIVYTVPG